MLKNLLVGLLIIFAFVGGYFFSQKYDFKLTKKTSEVFPTTTPSIEKNLIGGDLDEHGCKGSAGYSWCEIKQKCLRVWEEKCEVEDLKTIIKQLFMDKYGQASNNLTITVSKEMGDFARGGASEQGGGGMWLAKKNSGSWQLVFDGNGVVDCQKLKVIYLFPSEILTGVCD
ncbi:MAG: hypothetical protein WCT22_04940 [Patescibacteria group bacterium]